MGERSQLHESQERFGRAMRSRQTSTPPPPPFPPLYLILANAFFLQNPSTKLTSLFSPTSNIKKIVWPSGRGRSWRFGRDRPRFWASMGYAAQHPDLSRRGDRTRCRVAYKCTSLIWSSQRRSHPVSWPSPTVFTPDLTLARQPFRDTSLIRKRPPLGPYSRTLQRALWWS